MKFFRWGNGLMWVSGLAVTSVIFGILFKIFAVHWMYIAAIVPWAPIVLFTLVGLVFAFFMNPIRRLREKRNKKNEEK
jgi:hypothetical protein